MLLTSIQNAMTHQANRCRALTSTLALGSLIFVGLGGVAPQQAQAQTPGVKIKFVLDWKIQGVHAWFYWARDKGFFKDQGLDVDIDQGSGSAATVMKVMSGAYQAGFGDMNAIIQNASVKPGEAPVMVYMMYNKAPFALISKTSSGIKSIKDLEGKTLGSPAGAAALALFPALAKKNNLDEKKITWINMAPSLQEQMMLQGQVDASAVFSATSYMNLVAQNIDPDKDIHWIFYNDFGLDLYSNGIMVSAKLLKDNPKAVSGLVRAINSAFKDCVSHVQACVDNLGVNEPLINKEIEKRRMIYVLRSSILSPESAEIGLGDVKDSRMSNAIAQIGQSYDLQRLPAVSEVFNRSALPSKEERVFSPKLN
jgi:NitT/TauT family transport system substrate-binding protein